MRNPITYKSAGVDIDEGEAAVRRIAPHAARTKIPGVIEGLGGFGGLFDLGAFMKYEGKRREVKTLRFTSDRVEVDGNESSTGQSNGEMPILVAGADGVGTKLKVAFMMDKHDTVGIDCVAMNCNDILCLGARPAFFLDYIATGHLKPGVIEEIVKGIAEGCIQAGCALLGGETAEMPGFYDSGEYDLAGFAVGVLPRESIIDGSEIRAGDVILGLASSGLHSNGYSLVRKAFFEIAGMSVTDYVEELGTTLGEEILKPTRIYAKPVFSLLDHVRILGMAHITGGGLTENLPRCLPAGTFAVIDKKSWEAPTVFRLIKDLTGINDAEASRTFNQGIGMTVIVRAGDAEKALEILREVGERVWTIGRVERMPDETAQDEEKKPYVVFE
jgi:phosphoribosylformylglycinamidine cyclo-ligase